MNLPPSLPPCSPGRGRAGEPAGRSRGRPRAGSALLRRAALLAALLAAGAAHRAAAEIYPGSLTIRAEVRSPIREGREDAAFQTALDEALRHCVLDALRVISPERQSPRDFELWQQTVLTRAADFVGAYRILSQENRDGFLHLSVEAEVWRAKLARASQAGPEEAALASSRLLVLAESLPLLDPAEDEEVDAGRLAAQGLEAEFVRRGAVIVAGRTRAPWQQSERPASEDARAALAAAEGRAREADAVLIVQIAPEADRTLTLTAQLIAAGSEAALGSARAEVVLPESGVAGAFSAPTRQLAALLAPRLAEHARAARARALAPAPR